MTNGAKHSPPAFLTGGPFGLNLETFTNMEIFHFKLESNEVLKANRLGSKKTHPKELFEVPYYSIFGFRKNTNTLNTHQHFH